MPDAKTLLAWLDIVPAFGLAEEGVRLYERGGLPGRFWLGDRRATGTQTNTTRNCKRKAARAKDEDDETRQDVDEGDNEEEVEE